MNTLRKLSDMSAAFSSKGKVSTIQSAKQASINGNQSTTVFLNILQSCLLKINQAAAQRKFKDIVQVSQKLLSEFETLVKNYAESQETEESQKSVNSDSAKTLLTESSSLTLWSAVREKASDYFEPFQMASNTKSPKMILVALDCIQKLLACGFLYDVNSSAVSDESSLLINRVIRTIVNCFPNSDDPIQLQIIRCLLTGVTSNFFQDYHGLPFFSAIETSFCIFTNTKDPQNRRTAKAALTQIINTVIKRYQPNAVSKITHSDESGELYEVYSSSFTEFAPLPDSDVESASIEIPIKKDSLAVDDTPKDSIPQNDENFEAQLDQTKSTHSKTFGNKYKRTHSSDTHEIFFMLCKFSMAPSSSELNVLNQKRLALEFIQNIIQTTADTIKCDPYFISLIKKSLCISLIKNCVSPSIEIYSISLKIFVFIASKFKDALKSEIGVFVDQILLKLLTSKNCSYEHKLHVIQAFSVLFSDPVICLEFYLNFDCNVNEHDVFFSAIDALSKITQLLTLQQTALKTLVVTLSALYDWVKQFYEEAEKIEYTKLSQEFESNDLEALYSVTTVASSQNQQMIQQRQKKMQLQKGINIFNTNAQKGIQFLSENGQLENDPEVIASFFLKHPGLSKTSIGIFISELDPFNQSVLQHLIRKLNFTALEIDLALKYFLSLFRLPGEAQKIDRLMEQFAEKYIEDNPNKFSSADCAYVLSFSLIMLHTDAHSRSIKPENKMTLETFVKNNREIDDNKSLPREYLEELYNRIVAEEWILDEDKSLHEAESGQNQLENLAVVLGLLPSGAARRKFEQFLQESSEIVKKTTALIKKKTHSKKNQNSGLDKSCENVYVTATNDLIVQVKYLIESIHFTLQAAFFFILSEPIDDNVLISKNVIETSLKGIKLCVQLAAHFEMTDLVHESVVALVKHTSLELNNEIFSFTEKHVQCIQTLLDVAISEGNSILEDWDIVLECVSRLNQLQCFLWTDPTNSTNANQSTRTISSVLTSRLIARNTSTDAKLSFEQSLDKDNIKFLIDSINTSQIDLLFMRSVNLSNKVIIEFASALCKISKKELLQTPSRLFSLQKLVEIADHNMNRIRLIWSKIWFVLRGHFVEAATHYDLAVCLYSVDSMRQLAIKFLEKSDFGNYSFHNDFLKPLNDVMRNPDSFSDVKEFIVEIIFNIIQAQGVNLRNGWKCALNIISIVTGENTTQNTYKETLVVKAFKTIELIMENYFWIAFDFFNEIIRCLVNFALLKHTKTSSFLHISIKALHYLEAVALLFVYIDIQEYMEEHYKNVESVTIMRLETTKKQPTTINSSSTKVNKSSSEYSNTLNSLSSITEMKNSSYITDECDIKKTMSEFKNYPCSSTERYARIMSQYNEMFRPLEDSQYQEQLSTCWIPIFTSLSQVASSHFVPNTVSELALVILFRILDVAGIQHLGQDLWQMILRGVILPLFDDLHLQLQSSPNELKTSRSNSSIKPTVTSTVENNQGKQQPPPPPPTEGFDQWAVHQSWYAVNHLVELASNNFDCMQHYLAETIYLISSCVDNQPEFLARIGIQSLKKFILQIKDKCSKDHWSQIIQSVSELYQKSTPTLLVNSKIIEKLQGMQSSFFESNKLEELSKYKIQFNQTEVITQCVIQLQLLNVIQDIANYSSLLYEEDIKKLLKLLWNTFLFARNFNRQTLFEAYWIHARNEATARIIKAGKESLILYFKVLMNSIEIYASNVQYIASSVACIVNDLIEKQKLVSETENQYIKSEADREIKGTIPILIHCVLEPLYSLPDDMLLNLLKFGFYQVLIQFILVENKDLRIEVYKLLHKKSHLIIFENPIADQ